MVTCQVCQQFCITRGWLHMQRKKHWQSTSTLVVSGVVFIRMSIRRALKVEELILSWFHSKKVPNRSDFCHFCHFLYRFKPTSLHILLPSPRCHYNFDFSSSCSFSTRFVRELTNSTEKRITFEIRFGTTFLLRFVSNLDDPHCNIVSSYKFLTYNNHLHISNIHSHHYCLSLSLSLQSKWTWHIMAPYRQPVLTADGLVFALSFCIWEQVVDSGNRTPTPLDTNKCWSAYHQKSQHCSFRRGFGITGRKICRPICKTAEHFLLKCWVL